MAQSFLFPQYMTVHSLGIKYPIVSLIITCTFPPNYQVLFVLHVFAHTHGMPLSKYYTIYTFVAYAEWYFSFTGYLLIKFSRLTINTAQLTSPL